LRIILINVGVWVQQYSIHIMTEGKIAVKKN